METTNTAITAFGVTAIDTSNFNDISDANLKRISLEVANLVNQTVAYNVDKYKQLCIQFGKIVKGELYKTAAYKDFGTFAADKYGFKSSKAYAMAKAGVIYLDDKVCNEVKQLTPGNIVELAPLVTETPNNKGTLEATRERVNKAAKDGKLTGKTQTELREFAKDLKTEFKAGDKSDDKTPADKPTKVYTAVLTHDTRRANSGMILSTLDVKYNSKSDYAVFADADNPPVLSKYDVQDAKDAGKIFKAGTVKVDGKACDRYITFTDTDEPIAFILKEYKPKKQPKQNSKSKTADITAMSTEDILKALSPEQLAALINGMNTTTK